MYRGRHGRLPREARDDRRAARRHRTVSRIEAGGSARQTRVVRVPRARAAPAPYLVIVSISASSAAENCTLLAAATASSTCDTLLAPISDDVTTGSRSVHATAI